MGFIYTQLYGCVLCFQLDDGYPHAADDNGDEIREGAPKLEEGETQSLSEYPAPVEATEEANGGDY